MRTAVAATVVAASAAAGAPAAGAYEVTEVGSFHIGGRQVTLSGLPEREIVFTPGAPPLKVDPNGDFEAGQMYVQFVKLQSPRGRFPLLLWHGGGLTGVTWETKPDGKPGWQQYFLRNGHDVYVSDAVERGRASWARYPEIYKTEPFFRTKKEGWELFRIGPTYDSDPSRRVAFDGTQFPVTAYDQFARQSVPRWASNDAATQEAYDALVQKVCPCVIIVHSQGGNFAFNAALRAPDKVKAIVAVEPSGAPDPAKVDLKVLKNTPHLFVWGDFIDKNAFWKKIIQGPQRYQVALAAAGAVADVLDLPKAGLAGNSHMLMMDRNSDEVAGMIQAWMGRQGLLE